MPSYVVQYFTPNGKLIKKVFDAVDIEAMRKQFEGRLVSGLKISIHEGRRWNKERLNVPFDVLLANMDVIEVLLNTGVPLQLALRKLVEGLPAGPLRFMWSAVAQHIEQNTGEFAPALRQFPKVFPEAVCGMIASGSVSGDTARGVHEARDYLESMHDLKKTAQGAMIYPSIVMGFAAIVFTVIMFFTVPQFKTMIIEMVPPGTKLPIMTKIFFGFSDLLTKNPAACVFALVATLTLGVMTVRMKSLKAKWYRLWLVLPVTKDVMWNLALARFTTSFGTSYGALGQAITALEGAMMVTGNPVIFGYLEQTLASVKNGRRLGEAMREVGKFPAALVVAIENGEAKLPYVMTQMGAYYTKEAKRTVATSLKLLEPAMIVFVLGFAGTAVFAMFLPMLTVFKALSKQ
jgi:type IV pilus assembly protein PilC